MNGITALLIAGSLLLAAVAPVAAINDGTSNTRGGASLGCATAAQGAASVDTKTREGGNG
jgi:hypothetical protein